MDLFKAIQEYDKDKLLLYLQEEIENKGKCEELMQIYRYDFTNFDPYDSHGGSCTSLQLALLFHECKEVISKFVDIGGRKLVMGKNRCGYTVLHSACWNGNTTCDKISKLIEMGGRELAMQKGEYERTALHFACDNEKTSFDTSIILKLIEVGGRELVIEKNLYGRTALHGLCANRRSTSFDSSVISKLIEVGGREFVMARNHFGINALHYACSNDKNVSLDTNIISKLIKAGGKELVMEKTRCGHTALHLVCMNKNATLDIISKLIEVGGPELLMMKDIKGDIALHYAYFVKYDNFRPNYNDVFELLLKESILANIGGEFGIAGLFNVARQDIQDNIYEKWGKLLPALKSTVKTLQQQPPILHAAILAQAPLHVFQDIISNFEYSILKADSLGRNPIVVALEEGTNWNEGLQEVVEATAVALHQQSSIYTAAHYGLKWGHYMKELAGANVDEIMNGHDDLTGLRLFMVAATGESNDLSAIYGMMRMSP